MGLLRGSIGYLAGPMDRVDDNGVGWRRWIKPYLNDMGIKVIDPTDKPIDRGYELNKDIRYQMIKDSKFDELSRIMREIRCIDLRCCDKSDFLIVNYDMSVHLCGTMEEIFVSNRQKKPILLYFEKGFESVPYWMWGTLPKEFIFDDWNILLDYLFAIDNGKPCHKRWILFDWTKI